jgi:Domain of unknown function (DUF1906)
LAHRLAKLLCCLAFAGAAAVAASTYLGFDRNDYPGDAALPALRRTFRYTGYWLNSPPGETQNSWTGKRAILKKNGFGFLVLFNGRTDAQLQGVEAADAGARDGRAAVAAALREGFAPSVLIFLDQEEGGRLLPEQAAYLFAWIRAVQAAGAQAGVYCSGIPVPDGTKTITTAQDIVERLSSAPQIPTKSESAKGRVALWIAQDQCPPSPGCTVAAPPLAAVGTLAPFVPAFVAVWQYAQSPRRAEFSASCPRNQAPDGNCYAPGLPHDANTFIDLDVTSSPDPSEAPR